MNRPKMVRSTPDLAACYCTALRRAARQASLHYDRALAATGLTVGQLAILAEVEKASRSAPPTIGRLAETLAMDRAGLRHTLNPLMRDGLLTLTRKKDDARAWAVGITGEGVAKLQAAAEAWTAAQTTFESAIGRNEAAALRALLTVTDRLSASR